MRNHFADTIYALAPQHPELCVLVADISPAGSMAKFREQYPERFINTGVAEQIMIGMAAGMALRGFRPFAYTIATFALYRAFEFVRDDLCYQDLPVTVVGIGGGLLYSTLGSTHHAQEDIAVATALPNLQVIAPCDPAEAQEATQWCAQRSEHPTYLRLGKAGEPNFTLAAEPWEFGKLRYLKRGTDVCVLSYGHSMATAMQVAQQLEKIKGQTCSVVSVHTLKPLDVAGIVDALHNHRDVIVIEEASGAALGQRVQALAHRYNAKTMVDVYQLPDRFTHCHGDHAALLDEAHMTPNWILRRYL